jgi:hypothetical protein
MLAAVPALSAGGDDPEENGRLLLLWQKGAPEHYQRIVSDYGVFQDYPEEKQKRIRAFHDALQAKDDATREHLLVVLERYRVWRDKLAKDQLKELDKAGTEERLKLVREWRQIQRLPEKLANEVKALPVAERAKRLAKLHIEEQARQTRWRGGEAVDPDWKRIAPKLLEDFPQEVQDLVKKTPWTSSELAKLESAKGKWPNYAETIFQLWKEHGGLPPLPGNPVVDEKSLLNALPEPQKTQAQLGANKLVFLQHRKMEGKWPEYALTVGKLLQANLRDKLPQNGRFPPLGACTREEFPPETRQCIKNLTKTVLTTRESKRLETQEQEKQWPEFPRNLMEMARRYGKAIPHISPPGPPGLWKAAKEAMSDR